MDGNEKVWIWFVRTWKRHEEKWWEGMLRNKQIYVIDNAKKIINY